MELKGLYSGCSLFRVGIYSALGKDSEKREVYSLSYTMSIPSDTLSAPPVPPTPLHPRLKIVNQNWSRKRNRRSFAVQLLLRARRVRGKIRRKIGSH